MRYITHEIRGNLANTALALQFLLNQLNASTVDGIAPMQNINIGETLEEIKFSTDMALATVSDLLDIDKIQNNMIQVERCPELVWPFIRRCVKPFELQASLKKLHFQWQYVQPAADFEGDVDQLSMCALMDAPKMEQVMRNMLSNALKFTPEGGQIDVEVRVVGTVPKPNKRKGKGVVDLRPKHSDGKDEAVEGKDTYRLRISVRDSGPGISAENQKKLFQQYVQIDAKKLQGGKGSGLGLWLSRAIMDMHGGHMGVMSDGEGMGSTFFVEIDCFRACEDLIQQSRVSIWSNGRFSVDSQLHSPARSNSMDGKELSCFAGHSGRGAGHVAYLPGVESIDELSEATDSVDMMSNGGNGRALRRGSKASTIFSENSRYDSTNSLTTGLLSHRSNEDLSLLAAPPPCVTEPEGALRSAIELMLYETEAKPPANGYPVVEANTESTTTAADQSKLPAHVQMENPSSTVVPPQLGALRVPVAEEAAISREVSMMSSSPLSYRDNGNSPRSTLTTPRGELNSAGISPSSPMSIRKTRSKYSSSSDFSKETPSHRFLIVDDSETSRKILSRLLKPISIVLDTANDGVEGVQKVRERLLSSEADYDVVISDSFMPNMNGPTMVAAIRELGFKGIVLGYTGTDDQEDHSKFKDAGTDAVLLKPMSADKLRNILNIPFKTPPTSPGKSPKS